MCHPETIIRAWTLQPWSVWKQVQDQGALTVDPSYVAKPPCYEWLRMQLRHRLPGYTGHYPWWAYSSLDLQQLRHYYSSREGYVLIELHMPQTHALTLTFWAWDLIFWGRFLSYTQEESEDWHRRLRAAFPDAEDELPPLPEPWQPELTTSWERLFDPNLPAHGWWIPWSPPVSPWEVVFEVLDLTHIRRVTPFPEASSNATPHQT